ncbi:MAG: hypothetical protein HC895_17505 [Leptolyngbyaceae cyanobacterium SM1_3_5]|nr:hypothetical protein [Leptolyngbyaceae cyanobacterium SM1_3_5]
MRRPNPRPPEFERRILTHFIIALQFDRSAHITLQNCVIFLTAIGLLVKGIRLSVHPPIWVVEKLALNATACYLIILHTTLHDSDSPGG